METLSVGTHTEEILTVEMAVTSDKVDHGQDQILDQGHVQHHQAHDPAFDAMDATSWVTSLQIAELIEMFVSI